MLGRKQYIFNKETLSYEIVKPTLKRRILRCCIVFGLGFLCFAAYSWIYSEVFSLKTLKTKILESRNEELLSQIKGLNQKLDEKHRTLMEIEMRDNIVYRPIFGMEEIPSEVRDAGFGGVDRYSHLEHFEHSDILISSAMRLDILSKKASVQSRSFDEVSFWKGRRYGLLCASIFPVSTHPRNRLGSRFGYRSDPSREASGCTKAWIFPAREASLFMLRRRIVVEVCCLGYGNQVIVDHGFGYKHAMLTFTRLPSKGARELSVEIRWAKWALQAVPKVFTSIRSDLQGQGSIRNYFDHRSLLKSIRA